MPSTKNSNKSLKIRLRKNRNFIKRTKLDLVCVHLIYFGASVVFERKSEKGVDTFWYIHLGIFPSENAIGIIDGWRIA